MCADCGTETVNGACPDETCRRGPDQERIARLRRLAALARDRSVDSDAVAMFTAAVSPDVVTALLDEIERLREIVAAVAADNYPAGEISGDCAACGTVSPTELERHEPDCWWRRAREEQDRA